MSLSGVPVPIHIKKTCIEGYLPPDLIESSVTFMIEFYQVTMCTIAERSIGRILTIT